MTRMPYQPLAQRGVVLISALLLLIVMTILAMTMCRTNGVQELIAGNVREKQRAVEAAEDAEQYAELWLSSGGNIFTDAYDCTKTGLVTYGATSVPPICKQQVSTIDDKNDVTSVPWTINGVEVGATFYPGNAGTTNDLTVSTTPGPNSYYQPPRLYVAWLSQVGNYTYYQVDAWSYGTTQNSVAVVEGIYVVQCTTCSF
jgi:type IV pilus assembly protein PilX